MERQKREFNRAYLQKAQQEAEASTWDSIHVLGYGFSVIRGKEMHGKVATDKLSAIAPLFSNLTALQQMGTTISLEKTYALNIVKGLFIEFLPNSSENKEQRIAWDKIDKDLTENLAAEIADNLAPSERQIRYTGRWFPETVKKAS